MLSKVEVTTAQGNQMVLLLQDISNGYLTKDISGLDPVKANLVSSSFANLDGEQYQSSRREKRNIVIKLGLIQGFDTGTVRDLRNRLYGFFMPETEVHMRYFVDGEIPVDIYGRIETCDVPLFAKEPEATISLLCYNPDFYDPNPTIVSGVTTIDESEFIIDYAGTIETGIKLHLDVNSYIENFKVFHRPADNSLRSLEFTEPLSMGDMLDISTISGAKGAVLTRAGSTSSILKGISPFSNWITLYPGPNFLRVYSEGAAIPYSIEYTTKYGGL